jgi:hypothetical protein
VLFLTFLIRCDFADFCDVEFSRELMESFVLGNLRVRDCFSNAA